MELSAAAEWLNDFFNGFDSAVLGFWHDAAEAAGPVLTPLAKAMTLIGEKGLLLFLLAAILLCFPKTRKIGVCVFGAVCCGALITSIILKDFVARPRPFEADAIFREWWIRIGSPAEEGFSFPSGHATSSMAGATALVLAGKNKKLLPVFAYPLLIAVSRNYLMAHYPSDVLAGICVGAFSALVAWGITLLIFDFLEKNKKIAFFAWILNFDVRDWFRPKKVG